MRSIYFWLHRKHLGQGALIGSRLLAIALEGQLGKAARPSVAAPRPPEIRWLMLINATCWAVLKQTWWQLEAFRMDFPWCVEKVSQRLSENGGLLGRYPIFGQSQISGNPTWLWMIRFGESGRGICPWDVLSTLGQCQGLRTDGWWCPWHCDALRIPHACCF